MSKHDDNYCNILRGMQCAFCLSFGEQRISWHHLKCIGALRKESWSAVPSCDCCHSPVSKYPSCHNAGISKEEQKEALSNTWYKVIMRNFSPEYCTKLMDLWEAIDQVEEMGEFDKWGAKGKIYWQALIDHKVI